VTTNNLSVLPIWKKGASLADRLEEVACYVRANPERFSKFVMAYLEELPNGNWEVRTLEYGCDIAQQIGLFELGKDQALKESER